MQMSFEDLAKLAAIRTELAEVLQQLRKHREVLGGDIDTAIEPLELAVAEVDRTIAEAER